MQDHEWLTVDEASLLCAQMGLSRTKKTIRNWARNGHVHSRKQSTSKGDMWVLEKAELIAKITSEIEFAEQHKQAQTNAVPEPQSQPISEPVQTGANPSEPVRTLPERFEPVRKGARTHAESEAQYSEPENQADLQDEIKSLEHKIMELRIDVGWRSQALDQMKKDNETMQENMHGQARYIGHLESDLLRLGGNPDQQFLAAPTPKAAPEVETPIVPEPHVIERPHPDQSNLYSG